MAQTIIKGVKLRLYPNAKQRDQLTQMFEVFPEARYFSDE